jgi:hypothetical protein
MTASSRGEVKSRPRRESEWLASRPEWRLASLPPLSPNRPILALLSQRPLNYLQGTTIVNGSVQFPGDTNDFFIFQDLVPGTELYFTALTTVRRSTSRPGILVGADTALPGSANPYVFTASDPNIVTSLSVPSDGVIVFDVITNGGEGP